MTQSTSSFGPLQPKRAFISLPIKLLIGTVGILALVSAILYESLSERERTHLVDAKKQAAGMVADLFAATVAAPLDFGDNEALNTELSHLAKNPDVVYAAVYARGTDEPVAELPTPRLFPAAKAVGVDQGVHVTADLVSVTRRVTGRSGQAIGRTLVAFSLASENAAYEQSRSRILLLAVAMSAGTALVLIWIARRLIIAPLAKLGHAARRVELGDLKARAEVRSTDEIGQLAGAFNSMADAVLEREQNLQAARQSIRDLFDNMKEAIVAFGPDGRISGDASQQALRIFGKPNLEGLAIHDLLYPGAQASDVEATAFAEWVRLPFVADAGDWDECVELAPQEVVLRRGTDTAVPLELEFRPVQKGGTVDRVMLLATDVSEKRRLEETVRSQEQEHARQMAAMRRLIAGGTQIFVDFIESTKQRLDRCIHLTSTAGEILPSGDIDELFRHVHTIKGEAKAFDMRDLARESEKLEEELDEMRSRARGEGLVTSGSVRSGLLEGIERCKEALARGRELFIEASPAGQAALDQVTVQRSDLAELVNGVGARTDALGRLVARLASRHFGESIAKLIEMVPTWAARDGKQARLEIEGREVRVHPSLARALAGTMTHLVRNAIAHGIELPNARESANKPPVGIIRVAAVAGEGGPVITVQDDGQGFDTAKIEEAAALVGARAEGRSAVDLAFVAGVTTKAGQGGDLAGHGVGLGAVRAELLEVGYTVEIASTPRKGTIVMLRPPPSARTSGSSKVPERPA
jgi:two-component system, chemotaxis family, sensor kinase CheA